MPSRASVQEVRHGLVRRGRPPAAARIRRRMNPRRANSRPRPGIGARQPGGMARRSRPNARATGRQPLRVSPAARRRPRSLRAARAVRMRLPLARGPEDQLRLASPPPALARGARRERRRARLLVCEPGSPVPRLPVHRTRLRSGVRPKKAVHRQRRMKRRTRMRKASARRARAGRTLGAERPRRPDGQDSWPCPACAG